MPRQYQPLEVNSFTQGLITEASALTFPTGAAISMDNFALGRDGSVSRRLGMAPVVGAIVASPTAFTNKEAGTNVFEWDNPSGIVDRALLVFQDGNRARIIDRVSFSQIGVIALPSSNRAAFASVDNRLVIATNSGSIIVVSFNGSSLSQSSGTLSIRDVFGVDDGLVDGQSVSTRPIGAGSAHVYNLRNQSWANARKFGNEETVGDPIVSFSGSSSFGISLLPSNADTVNQALFADPADEDDRVGRRFFRDEVLNNPIGTTAAAKGHYIIDALSRGASRISGVRETERANSYGGGIVVASLPTDRTPGGATVVQEYAGRAFYAGFSGATVGGDSQSPNLSSYVLFSRLVRSTSDTFQCYTAADPTSPDDFNQVATDGGFLRIDGANNIQSMVVLRDRLFVLAENGVWSVSGGGEGFSSTDIVVNKVTDKGIAGASSVVVTDQSLLYWSESGIYAIGPNEFGDYHPNNLSNTTIQSLFNSILFTDKERAVGVFDSYEQKVRWQYGSTREIVLDLNLKAFYTNSFGNAYDLRASFTTPPFSTALFTELVRVNGETVTVNGTDVTITTEERRSETREVAYLGAREGTNGTTEYQVGTIIAPNFTDWGVTDAKASLITGYTSLGDYQRYKDVPYLTLHFLRTEDGFSPTTFEPTNQSSCLVRVAWEWTNSEVSGRWTRQFQGYRYRRAYLAQSADDPYDTGDLTIITKNKIRGKGKVFSIHMETEAGKDCRLLGWSFIVGVAGNV